MTPSSDSPSTCPKTWAEARALCAGAGSCTSGSCLYPGAGDQLPDGTWADALLACYYPSAVCSPDAGAGGGGVGEWRCGQ